MRKIFIVLSLVLAIMLPVLSQSVCANMPGDSSLVVPGGGSNTIPGDDHAIVLPPVTFDKTGTCGEDAKWVLNKDTNELSITGTGDVVRYAPSSIKDSFSSARISAVSVTVAGTINGLDNASFRNFTSLKEFRAEDGLLRIEDETFKDCKALRSVYIPASVSYIGAYVFDNVSDVIVYFDGTFEEWTDVELKEELPQNVKIVFVKEVVQGDINGDGARNNKDITVLFRLISGSDINVNVYAVDHNEDGNVNNKDITTLFRQISGG